MPSLALAVWVVVVVVGMRLQITEGRSFRKCRRRWRWWARGPVAVQTTTILARGRPTNYIDTAARVIKVHSVQVRLLRWWWWMLTVPQQGLVPKQVLLWLHDVVVVVVVQSPVERKSGRKDHLIKRINITPSPISFQYCQEMASNVNVH